MGAAWAALVGVLWALLAVTASAAPAAALTPGAATHGLASGTTPRAASGHHGRTGRIPGPITDAGRASTRGPFTHATRESAAHAGRSAARQAPATRTARGAAVAGGLGHWVRGHWHGSVQGHRSLSPLGSAGLAVVPERVAPPADRLVAAAPRRGPPAPRVSAHLGAARGRAPPVSVG